jgi:2-keto-4-pentenoate hydratase/2-oxohepta-3-ene-1,7-dioic acid hydratase in catechol pathway
MRIIRFLDADGRMTVGEPADEQTARVLTGDLTSGFRVTDDRRRILKRLCPVDPPNIFAIGLNYRAHAAETGAKLPDHPLVFSKATTALSPPGAPIILPRSAPDEVDYEAELAVVIGRTCRRVPEQDALDVVAGFTCANDVTARDCQKRIDRQWTRAKGFDTFCPLGPVMVTPDELDCQNLRIESRLNGRVMQSSSTADMIFSVRRLIAYLSEQFTLLAGTVILTGTPEGVGVGRTPPVFLREGDEITIQIEGIGELVNPVIREP